jgi:hypothetical protein
MDNEDMADFKFFDISIIMESKKRIIDILIRKFVLLTKTEINIVTGRLRGWHLWGINVLFASTCAVTMKHKEIM